MKRNHFIRMTIVLAVFCLMISGCQGPGGNEASSPTSKATSTPGEKPKPSDKEQEQVKLTWYSVVYADRPDTDMVWEKVNDYLKKKIHTTLDYHFYNISDFKEKMPAVLASGQYLDILATGTSYNFAANAQKNAFHPMEDLIPKYMPKTKKIVPDGAWDAVTMDDHIYAVVPYKDLAARWGYIYNKTMTDEYGITVPESGKWSVFQDLIPMLYEAKQKRDAAQPDLKDVPIMDLIGNTEAYYPHEVLDGLAVVNVPGVEAFKGKGKGETVFNIFETKEYKELCETIKKLVHDGIFPYDAANFDKDKELMKAHKLLGIYPQGYIEIQDDMNPGQVSALTNSDLSIMTNSYVRSTLQAISSKSKHPERAAMFLELLNTDPVVSNYARFGIEGQHYSLAKDGRIDITDSPRNGGRSNADYGYYYWYGGEFGNILGGNIPTFVSKEFPKKLAELNDGSIKDTNLGFSFDTTPVTNEIAACSNVISQFDSKTNLKSGMIEDIDGTLNDFLSKLKANGSQKIVDEAQRQLTKWRASVGKSTK